MEKNGAIAVESGGGVIGVIAVKNGGGTKTEKETTIIGGYEKEAIAVENEGVSEKEWKEASKGGKKKKKKKAGDGIGQKKTTLPPDDQTTPVVVTSGGGEKGCRLQVSNTKRPLFFYLNVAKRYIKQNNYVELSALGMAIPTVVTIAEILKKDGLATEKDISISTVTLKDDAKGRVIMKAKVDYYLSELCDIYWAASTIGILLVKPKDLEKQKLVAAKDPSEISENVTKEYSPPDTSGKIFEKRDHSETNGTLSERKDSQNTNMRLTEGKESSSNNKILSEKKDTCGSNGKMTDTENT